MAAADLTMPIARKHDLHVRRGRRNILLAGLLLGFVVLVFAITVVKLSSGHLMEAFDHVVRPSLLESSDGY